MFVPERVIEWFTDLRNDADSNAEVAKSAIADLREELSAVRAERDSLKLQNAVSQNHFDWLRLRVNALETERAQLIKKAYGIDLPVPEIVRAPQFPIDFNPASMFEDVGEKTARELGLPVYGGADEFPSDR